MSVNPGDAPFRPAYLRDSGGLYYRIGGGGGAAAVYVGVATDEPDPEFYGTWVVTADAGPWDTPIATGSYSVMISDGTRWFPIAGGTSDTGQRPTAAFTYTVHWSDVEVDATSSYDPDGYVVAYDWDWGDGSPHDTGPLATHSYATSGSKAITLTITDDQGNGHQVLHTVSVVRMYGPVTFITTGSTFSPWMYLTADSPNLIEWVNEATGAVVAQGPHPVINFGTAGVRTIEMYQSIPEDVLTLNLGYNPGDDTGRYLPGISGGATSYTYPGELCSGVSGLGVMPNLVNFMAANGPMSGHLDFDGLSHLEFIECAYAHVSSASVVGCTSLIRFCLEQNNIGGGTIDLNPVRNNLRDLRMAFQNGVNFTPLVGPMAMLYHECTRDQICTNLPKMPDIPAVEELWIWNTGQTGALVLPPAILDARVSDNGFTSLDLTLTSGVTLGRLAASRNPLTSIVGLATGKRFPLLELVGCSMSQALVDQILADVNSWNTSNGTLELTGNTAPTGGASNANRLALVSRGWAVNVS